MKSHTLVAILATALLGSASAIAGHIWGAQVTVVNNAGNVWAGGAIGDAFNSADPFQVLYCSATTQPNGVANGTCWASDANNTWVGCSTADPTLVANIQAISGDAYVEFNAQGGICTRIYVTKGSAHRPKKP